MTEKCNEVRDAIALEGKAPDNDDYKKHLAECADCARLLESVLAIGSELAELQTEDVSDEVVANLLARPELSSKAGSRRTLHWAMGLAAAATVAFVAARVTLMSRQQLVESEAVVAFNVNPVAPAPAGSGGSGGEKREADERTEEQRQSLDALGYISQPSAEAEEGNETAAFYETLPSEPNVAEKAEQAQNQLRKLSRANESDSFFQDEDAGKDDRQDKERDAAGRTSSTLTPPPPPPSVAPENEPKRQDGGVASGVGGASARESADEPMSADPNSNTTTVEPKNEMPPVRVGEGISDSVGFDKARLQDERRESGGFRTRVVEEEDEEQFSNYQRVAEPRKILHVDAVYPEAAKSERINGTVVLRAHVDRVGNVTRAIVVESVAGLDQAAIDAVLQWKYEPADVDERQATARIAFEAPAEPDNHDARLFLEERERIESLRFREARGYWANTYAPGDPEARFLAMRLRHAEQHIAPHVMARPVAQPFDEPRQGALSLTLHADRRSIGEPSRLLVQVGLQATEDHGRRRPPMNVGIVLDPDAANLASMRALVQSFQESKELGDRFRLIVPGRGELIAPDAFRLGPLTVALDEIQATGNLSEAVRLAMERVHAGDDPTMPLGTSLVLVVTGRTLGSELDTLSHLAHRSAVGGVPLSVVGVGSAINARELEHLALSGQGRRYLVEQVAEANAVVERELAASSRVVARAVRLRIKLAAGVQLVDVIGSKPLNERQAEQVREAEKSIDLRLSRNLGIEADRGEDEDGIQIVIPSFYAGDAHTILLDVVATNPGAIAEVTARYKDLAELENTVARASLSLSRATSTDAGWGPLEANVLKNFLAHHLSNELESAAGKLESGDRSAAIEQIARARRLLTGLPLGRDAEIAQDVAMLRQYESALSTNLNPTMVSYLADSLRYAGASKIRLPAALT